MFPLSIDADIEVKEKDNTVMHLNGCNGKLVANFASFQAMYKLTKSAEPIYQQRAVIIQQLRAMSIQVDIQVDNTLVARLGSETKSNLPLKMLGLRNTSIKPLSVLKKMLKKGWR